MARRISEKRYQKLLKYEKMEKAWNKLMAEPNTRKIFDPERQEREKRQREYDRAFEQMKIAKDIDLEMANASVKLYIAQLLDSKTPDFIEGFEAGYNTRIQQNQQVSEIFDRHSEKLKNEFRDCLP